MQTPTLGGWLVHVMRKADGALSLEESLHVLMDSTKEFFPCHSIAVILIDEDTKALRIKISRQISYTFAKQFRRDAPGPAAERVVLEQKPVRLAGLPADTPLYREVRLEHDFTSALLAPIIKNQRGVGYVFCDRAEAPPFDDADMLHLQVIGYLIGQVMEKFELIAQSRKLSSIDDATQALQYKAFVPLLATELERARAHAYPVTLALLAVDAFRRYIDCHGIDAAHAMLADVVRTIKPRISDLDLQGRFGADELILCLSNTDGAAAKTKLRALQEAVFEAPIGHADAPVRLTVGMLTLPDTRALRLPLQDILGELGRRLADAKTAGIGTLEAGTPAA